MTFRAPAATSKQNEAVLEGASGCVRESGMRLVADNCLQGAVEEPELETRREGASTLSVSHTHLHLKQVRGVALPTYQPKQTSE